VHLLVNELCKIWTYLTDFHKSSQYQVSQKSV